MFTLWAKVTKGDDNHNIIVTVRTLLSRQKRYHSVGGKNYNIAKNAATSRSYNIATNVATSRSYNIAANVATSRSYNIATNDATSRSYNIAANVATSRSYNIAATAMRVAATDRREIWRWPAALQLL